MKNGTRRLTFSINTPENLITGRLYKLAKKLDLSVVGVYRHNLEVFDLLLKEAEDAMGDRGKHLLSETISMLSMSTVIREEGIRSSTKPQIMELLRRAGRADLAQFVEDLTTVEVALLIDRARYQIAYPPYDEDEDVGDEDFASSAS